MPELDDLELMLDAALAGYGDPGPDSGLEQRILARLETKRLSVRRRRRLLCAAAIPAMAALLLLLISPAVWRDAPKHSRPRIDAPVQQPLTASAALPEVPALIERTATPAKRETGRHATHPLAAPKLDVFPAPAPLSSEEQLLVSFVSETSAAQRKELLEAQKQPDAPLRIAAISIPPIELPAEGKE
ncbi:MAG TPA: hypothetical protein VE291_03375 [Terracidiphilus sp.]|jgi:hypothetical protein|nr:hypothetical protein [Terracidiphilus sp.]